MIAFTINFSRVHNLSDLSHYANVENFPLEIKLVLQNNIHFLNFLVSKKTPGSVTGTY